MRAAVRTSYGPPETVRVTEVPDPEPGLDEVLVQVDATTVNRTDCAYRSAKPFFMRALTGLRRPRHTILGTEFTGHVVTVGSAVDRFSVGDRVLGYVEGRFGAHAELLAVRQTGMIATVPSGLGHAEAAAALEGSHYARSAIRRAGVTAGDHVLVYGATGGIGSAAVQLLAASGVTVTAVCAGEHAELVRSLGADRVVDYTTEDFTQTEQRYDVIIDAVGKSRFGVCRKLLTPEGVYVSSELGPGGQNLPLSLVGTLRRGHRRVVFPFPEDGQGVAEEIRDMLAAGTFRPVIDRTYPLEDIAEAYRYVESGQKIGNVVITVSDAAAHRSH